MVSWYDNPVIQIYIIDAFSDAPFRGNPAGVALLDSVAPADWMQRVAAELRHSETAFVGPPSEDGLRALRWFTPVAEVELCGHATLAAAHVLGGNARFESLSGVLSCTKGQDEVIWMDFPADKPQPIDLTNEDLRFVAGGTVLAAARGRFDLLLELASEKEVRQANVKYEELAQEPYRGLILTAVGKGGVDVVSRCFYPKVGVPEDPVTGSAHCTLASWWSERLSRDRLVAEQASARGGSVMIEVAGDRVWLGGSCTTVLEGILLATPSGSLDAISA